MKYYYIDGDDADYLYLGRESKPDIKLCPHCKWYLIVMKRYFKPRKQ